MRKYDGRLPGTYSCRSSEIFCARPNNNKNNKNNDRNSSRTDSHEPVDYVCGRVLTWDLVPPLPDTDETSALFDATGPFLSRATLARAGAQTESFHGTMKKPIGESMAGTWGCAS